ncbi:hypothetical protein PO878_16375 [Iamia majanohamensis]|uniref:Uncharacterized protein n=1 Tax=Iamia majanohamensis TaxID=467976 RepID=A0AAE9YBP5_9ACTN|nr:hypothetical protein [Iamia majanohamensis]WCO66077.1 hypothetical protein PO878_16375 [Iamia majanohamensis]
MEVVVGPVSADSTDAYVRFGREVLHAAGPGADVPSDAASAFDAYLDEWEAMASDGGDVTWVGEAEPEVVEYLVYSFFRVAQEVRQAAGDRTVVPEEASSFYRLLVSGLLGALEEEGGSRAEFAAHLREFWPGGLELP